MRLSVAAAPACAPVVAGPFFALFLENSVPIKISFSHLPFIFIFILILTFTLFITHHPSCSEYSPTLKQDSQLPAQLNSLPTHFCSLFLPWTGSVVETVAAVVDAVLVEEEPKASGMPQ